MPSPRKKGSIRSISSLRLTIGSRDVISGYWYPLALEQVLPRLAPTLEELEVHRFMVDQDHIQSSGGILTEPVFTMTQYPAVRTLSTPHFQGKPLLDYFYYLFPALESFHLDKPHHSVREDDYPHIRAAKINRRRNAHRYAADALRENPVPHLKVTLGHGRTMADELFTPELAGTMTHPTLCMSYYNHINIHSGLEGDNVPRLRRGFPVRTPEEYAHTLRGSTFNFNVTAASLVRPFPSLRHFFLTTCGVLSTWNDSNPCERPMKPYERWKQDAEQTLVALHDEAAETIIRQEHLVLSESDEEEIQRCVVRG
uniref:Transcriptional repressor TUP1 n=1 Tax=Ganoderma boninense TaxID=34458 RepID=A0A5K1JU33_9APHY|nr:Transcriptional repressor TUP1 [Ganoderma boninense]